MSAGVSKVSWLVALAVGVVIGVASDRMLGGSGRSASPTARPAPARPAPPSAPPLAPPPAPPIEDTHAVYRVRA